jgi:outer membrane cobalamin receptor
VVTGAEVNLQAGTFSASGKTDAGGRFAFESVPQSGGTLTVRAIGFAEARRDWSTGQTFLEIVLAPATVNEQIVITATRLESRLSEVAGGAVALTSRDLSATPALAVDDKLRQIPGFTLFRRSGSRTANPTSQGVSLSGLGTSGASRALVLLDGVPLNDPFGGWVYWGRIPQQELAGVEVIRSGISDLYGSDALGGVVQFLTRHDAGPALSLETSFGSGRTPNLSFWAGETRGPWSAALSADLFHTEGYVLVPTSFRGSVDTPASSEHAALNVNVGRRFDEHNRIFGRAAFFTEARHNGTPLQVNNTRMIQAVAGAATQWGAVGPVTFQIYGQAQGYNQSFSAVAANRNSESLTNLQHVPAQQAGGSAWWSRPAGRIQTLVAGVEADEVMGWSNERVFSSGTHLADTVAGGRQRTAGVSVEDILRLTAKWNLTAGMRFDHWSNFDARSLRTPLAPPGPTVATPFLDRKENAFSPRLSLLRSLGKSVSLTASAYRAFRAPTLNELYRAFRVGNVLTLANSGLRAERLTGAEAGASAFAFHRKLNVRGNVFWNDIVNPIANVTLRSVPALITRQRQNLGRTRSRGVDIDAAVRLSGALEISGGYQFVDAKVVRSPANTALEGLRAPQIPVHQFTLQARYWNSSRFMFGVQGRFIGSQFEDDQNRLPLDRYFTVDLLAGYPLGSGVEVFGAFENLLNQRYTVGLTPIPTLGTPLSARIGLRLNRPARD